MEGLKDTAIYPAIFSYADDGITITFPDLPGCISSAHSDDEALYMARDALGCWISANEDLGKAIPAPSGLKNVKCGKNQAVFIIDTWMPLYRDERISGSVKKNVTIPVWLNVAAEKAGLNFSKILQAGLKASLRVQ
ncbi:type II toxin-antitoxin system HicB family antitoxin [Pyramidobacter sp.]|uniref:type II toxin-antitoxin system HicB family antitoxin n=1 Tax=Pyramidobacter sp. TaxID=1943581 RepID=UPI0025D4067B|nr:type II toxin-antitoxin system HicB family antitoxin [Pyramidobacter sp.]MCI7404690.1 type II toxin-antitoxin system HicB family antitoxin [Pyramidobacter sp.]MDY3213411.1 type II toxin-antitoxin system HicB family antitoxin [Pyramidobacter sp.]